MSTTDRFTRNACRDVLQYLKAGVVPVNNGAKLLPVSNYRCARQIKLGKLHRTVSILVALQRDEDDLTRRRAIAARRAVFERVIARLQTMTLADVRRQASSA